MLIYAHISATSETPSETLLPFAFIHHLTLVNEDNNS